MKHFYNKIENISMNILLIRLAENVKNFILVIMGIELAINLAHSETHYYLEWLNVNNNALPFRGYSERMIMQNGI